MHGQTAQSRNPPVASGASPTSNQRSNISYISDPSESGSEYGDSEPAQQKTPYKTTPAAAATTTTHHPQIGSLRPTSSRTNPASRSAEHVHASGSPITSSRSGGGPYVIREVTISRHSGPRPASSGAGVTASEATVVGAAMASRVETPDPEGAIGVAVPWAPESVAKKV